MLHSSAAHAAELKTEVCILGGGPAGAACALRLAQLGHTVVLIEREPPGRGHIGESLTAGVVPLLEELGLRSAVESAGFLRPHGACVQWEGAVRELPAQTPGFQVDRGRFDALLLEAARAAGVHVLQPVAALTPLVDDERVRVPLSDGRVVQAQRLVAAVGRRAARPEGVRTAALYAYWDDAAAGDPRSRVEAGDDAWYWGAPLPDGSINCCVFVDASRCAGLDAAQREAWYRALLADSRLLKPCLDGRMRGAVRVCDATPRIDAQPISERIIKIGEAAFSVDPLSSQGVQAALHSALQAAACVHTMAHRPSATPLALRYYREQIERSASLHARLSAAFYAAAAKTRGSEFWTRRAAAAAHEPEPPHRLPALDEHVKLDARARWQRMPVLIGTFIHEAEALIHPALEAPISFIGSHPVQRLLEPLKHPLPVRALLNSWGMHCSDEMAASLLMRLWRQGIVGAAA